MTQRLGPPGLLVRSFGSADIDAAYALSSRIGWSQTLDDWHWIAQLGQGYVACHGGRLVGMILYWRFGSNAASIGAVMVDDAFRGQGVASKLLEACLAELGGRGILLYATPAGEPLYRKNGFTAFEKLSQHEGIVGPVEASVEDVPLAMAPEMRETVVRLAERASGIDRSEVVRSLLDRSKGFVHFHSGEPCGFALYRRYGLGFAIGPVVATGRHVGRILIERCLAELAGTFTRIDIPDDAELGTWLETLGLRHTGSAVGMRRGALPLPDERFHRVAIATQATG